MRASFYVTLHAARSQYVGNSVIKVHATGLTQKKPTNLPADSVAVRLTVDIPPEAFDAFTAEAVISIPSELVQHPITAVVTEPG